MTRDELWLVLDTALLGLGCRAPEDDEKRCKAIRKVADMFEFETIAERATRWLNT